jgi:hypothetical protein
VTDILKSDGGLEFGTLVTILNRVVNEPECYLAIKYAGLFIHVYPSRALPGAKRIHDRLKHFASFMVELSKEARLPPVALAFEWSQGSLSVGVMDNDGMYVWMPAQIADFERTQVDEPLTATFPFLDDSGQGIQPLEVFRKIRV